jgi:hypothetical protein
MLAMSLMFCNPPVLASIVDVSGIDVPPVNGPVCANCDGAGCSQCTPHYGGDDDPVDPDPDPDPMPPPTGGGQTGNPQPPTPSAPVVDPQKVFDARKEALLQEFRMPAGLEDDTPVLSSSHPVVNPGDAFGAGVVPTGLSDSEWKEAAQCQQALDILYEKWPLSAAEIASADKLEARRNALWKKAISIPGLTAEERERMRLKLHVLNTRSTTTIPTISKETVDKWLKPPPPLPSSGQAKPAVPTVNPVSSWLVGQFAMGQTQSALEFGGEVWADEILEEHSYGDLLGVGKIALAYKEGGTSSAITESVNYLVGKIPIPQAGVAVEGGRLYANIVFRVQNKFMTDAMQAAGGEFDKDKFWSDFNNDCNVWQKAVKGWVGYGTD